MPGPQRYGESYKVVSIDAEAKVAKLACGSEIAYDALINTAPLDITLRWLGQPKWADTLSHRRAITACFGCSVTVTSCSSKKLAAGPAQESKGL